MSIVEASKGGSLEQWFHSLRQWLWISEDVSIKFNKIRIQREVYL